jgi:HD-GYP domain-containing protein (c-di-GMP phosphodiesterase class II)
LSKSTIKTRDRINAVAARLWTSAPFDGIEGVASHLLGGDAITCEHSIHVHTLAAEWSEFNLCLSPPEAERLVQSSLLHDVGKVLIPESILTTTGALTAEEMRTVQQHAMFGEYILEQSESYRHIARIVGQHHEWWNGRGYPQGLSGEQIEPTARALSIIDAYSAMVLDRPYHCGISENEALAQLERCAGTQFDAELVRRFVAFCRQRLAA